MKTTKSFVILTGIVCVLAAITIWQSERYTSTMCQDHIQSLMSAGESYDSEYVCDDVSLLDQGMSEIGFWIEIIRMITGSIFILYLPGYWVSRCFFGRHEIDILERIALSFALSISVVPLLSFYLNLIGVKITTWNVFLITLLVITLSFAYLLFRHQKNISSPHIPDAKI